jgi:hypothetical protein
MGHASPPEGRVLGDFAIEREIGRGGMGVVYRARRRDGGQFVALKVLEAHLTLQPASVERFMREARAAAGLRHANIVRVDEVGECDGAWFFAMELIEGPSLADVITRGGFVRKDGGLDFARAAATLAKVAHALHHAHQRGILHRDVKPSNILLRGDGCPLLIDFGLVREEGLPALTRTGDLVGSPYYVAPEQCGGGHAPLDRRADVYSLGVVLYELVTLKRPFEGDDARDVLGKIATGDCLPPRQRLAAVPKDLDLIVRRAMAPRPEERYATAGALARDLERFAAGRRVLAGSGAWRRAAAALVRDRAHVLIAVAGLALIALLLGLGGFGKSAPRSAAALGRAQLTLTCEDAGVVAELRPEAGARGEVAVVALPQQAPLALAPGRYRLLARAPGREARELLGDQALELAAGATVVHHLWLAPFEKRFELAFDGRCAPPAVGDVDGDGRDEVVVAHDDGTIARIDGSGSERTFARVKGVPYAVAVAARRSAADAAARPTSRDALDGARVVVATQEGSVSRVVALDGRGEAAAPHALHGRVRALVDVGTPEGGAPLWCAATDVGEVEVVGGSSAAATTAGDAVRTLRALAKLLCDADGRPRTSTAHLFLLRSGGLAAARGAALALVDGDGVRLVGVAAGGALELRSTRELPVREVAAFDDAAGDRLVVALDGGRARVLDADGAFESDFACGECDALVVARTHAGARIVVAGARGLSGFDGSGAPRFDLPLDGRVTELRALDFDGDGDDELFTLLDGRRAVVWSSERDVRCKAGRDVRDFALAADGRLLLDEGGDAPCLLARDGRRLAATRLPCAITALDAADGALRCGAADGRVRELRLPAEDEGDALIVASQTRDGGPAITALAHGAAGDGGSARVVRGDANGAITFARPDGGGDLSFHVRTGRPVLALATGDVDGKRGDETFAALQGGTLVVFKTGGAPLKPIELGSECTALALLDFGAGGAERRVVAVALEGGELRWYDCTGARRGTLRGESTVTSLAPLVAPPDDADAPLAAAGTESGELRLLERRDGGAAWNTVAELGDPLVAVAIAGGDAAGRTALLVAGLTGSRAFVVTADGTLLLELPARGRRVALSERDGARELLYVDAAGRFTARPIPAAPNR